MSKYRLVCGSEVTDKKRLPGCVLSDDELLSLLDMAVYPDSLCWGEENGQIVGGYWDLAVEVEKAMAEELIAEEIKRMRSWQARAVFALRAFYLLGFQRGAETYRNQVAGEISGEDGQEELAFQTVPFELGSWEATDFVDDLNDTAPEYLNKLLAMVGMSAPTAAEDAKGDAEA